MWARKEAELQNSGPLGFRSAKVNRLEEGSQAARCALPRLEKSPEPFCSGITVLHKAGPTQRHHPAGEGSTAKRKSSAVGRQLASPSSDSLDAGHSPFALHPVTLRGGIASTRGWRKSSVREKGGFKSFWVGKKNMKG